MGETKKTANTQPEPAFGWALGRSSRVTGRESDSPELLEVPAAIYRSAQRPGLSAFGHLAFERLLPLFEPQKCKNKKKTLKEHSLGHSEPGAHKHSKNINFGGTFQPRPLGTAVNSGRDRNPSFGKFSGLP